MNNIADETLVARATALVHACAGLGLTIATAKSCTGGLLAGLLTEVPGSSAVLERGFVTYSNAAKTDMLGVPATSSMQFGAVSSQVAGAMAEGAIAHRARISRCPSPGLPDRAAAASTSPSASCISPAPSAAGHSPRRDAL